MYKVLLHSLLAHSLNYSLALSFCAVTVFSISLEYNNNNQ